MKNKFYGINREDVTPKVMKLMWGILIFDIVIFICLMFLFFYAIGKF